MIEKLQELLSQNELPYDNVSISIIKEKLVIESEGNLIFEENLYSSKIPLWISEDQKTVIRFLWNCKTNLAKNKLLAIDHLKIWCDEMGSVHDETVLFDICYHISKLP